MRKIQMEKKTQTEAKRLPVLIKLFMPFSGNLKSITDMPAFEVTKVKANDQLMMAGYDETISAERFLAVRILALITGITLFAFFATFNPMSGLLLGGVIAIYPGVWLKANVKRRHLEIMKALPNVLDLLTLSVEAGKDFLTALRDILERRKMDSLGEELRRTLQEIQLGKQRQQALRELANRVKLPDLTSTINAIIQAEELGVSIAELLKIQGDQLRNKRFSRAEKLANEAPVKILIPVVLFIFPPVFIILMGPIIIQALKTFL
jgi:tight adherence protein C